MFCSGLCWQQGAGEAIFTLGNREPWPLPRGFSSTQGLLITSHCQGTQFSKTWGLSLPADLARGQEKAILKEVERSDVEDKIQAPLMLRGSRDCSSGVAAACLPVCEIKP